MCSNKYLSINKTISNSVDCMKNHGKDQVGGVTTPKNAKIPTWAKSRKSSKNVYPYRYKL